jgi:hypothetical protein
MVQARGAKVGAGVDRASFAVAPSGKNGAPRRTRSAPASTNAASPGLLPLLPRKISPLRESELAELGSARHGPRLRALATGGASARRPASSGAVEAQGDARGALERSEIPIAFLDFSRVCSQEKFPPVSSRRTRRARSVRHGSSRSPEVGASFSRPRPSGTYAVGDRIYNGARNARATLANPKS